MNSMKKFFLTIAGLAALSSGKVWGFAGGPFDNGDPGGLLMERNGYYQCTFSFKNGTGYGVFTPDAQLSGGLLGIGGGGGGGGAGQAAFYGRGTVYTQNSFDIQRNANRSVFYYKGVTYVGACMGMPDIEQRTINGTCNATSDDARTTSQATNGGGGAGASLENTAIIVQNNTGFILNCGWEGKITRTRPTLRFKGKGELSVLSPTGNAQVTNLAFQAYQGLIGAIIQSTSNLQNATGAVVDFTNAQDAIDNALTSLGERVTEGSGTQPTFDEADVLPLKVTGSRRFF
jgi:hypothetical protein